MDYKDTVSILAWLSCYQKYPLQYTYLFCNFWTNIKIEFIFQPLFPPFFEVVGKHFIWHEIKTFSFRNKKLRKSFSFYSSWVLKTRRSCCMMAGFCWKIFYDEFRHFQSFFLFFFLFQNMFGAKKNIKMPGPGRLLSLVSKTYWASVT